MSKKSTARDVLKERVSLSKAGPLAPEAVLQRLATARDAVVSQSNRFLLGALFFSALYGVKLIGLRVDLILFDYKIFETPYGISLFCFCANVSLSIAFSRFLDARAFDRQLRAVCEKAWGTSAQFAYETYPQENAWLAPTSAMITTIGEGGVRTPIATLVVLLAGIALMAFYVLPIICGFHFLQNFEALADANGRAIQYWSVLGSLGASLLFAIASLSLMFKDFD